MENQKLDVKNNDFQAVVDIERVFKLSDIIRKAVLSKEYNLYEYLLSCIFTKQVLIASLGVDENELNDFESKMKQIANDVID